MTRPLTLELSDAQPHEASTITALLERNAPDCVPQPLEEVTERIGEFFVARGPDGQIAGCAALRPLDEQRVELRGLCVDAEWRGYRLGHRLLKRAIARAQARGLRLVCVTRIPAFFRAHGFAPMPLDRIPAKSGVPQSPERVAMEHVEPATPTMPAVYRPRVLEPQTTAEHRLVERNTTCPTLSLQRLAC